MALLAPAHEVRSLRDVNKATAERAARSCYDHPAGAVGVAVGDARGGPGGRGRDALSLGAAARFAALGVNVAALGRGRRPLTRSCLDWSERRPHLSGELGAALLAPMLDAGRRPPS